MTLRINDAPPRALRSPLCPTFPTVLRCTPGCAAAFSPPIADSGERGNLYVNRAPWRSMACQTRHNQEREIAGVPPKNLRLARFACLGLDTDDRPLPALCTLVVRIGRFPHRLR